MNRREKILLAAFAAIAVVGIGYLVVDRLILQKAQDLDTQAELLRSEIDRLRTENSSRTADTQRLQALAGRTFDVDESEASERLRGHLLDMLERSGLGSTNPNLTLKPFTGVSSDPAIPRDVGKEVGWYVRTRGRLDRIVNFLYLLKEDPYLHRVDTLSLSPVSRSADIDMQVRYSTLVLLPLPQVKGSGGKMVDITTLETDRAAQALAAVTLDSPERRQYNVIEARDLFRPYVKRPPAPPTPASPPPVARVEPPREVPRAAPPPPDQRFRVVGLTNWMDRPTVSICDTATQEVRHYEPGEELAGGTIVAVDYRPMPMPRDPELKSGSRVILKIGPDFWAVELGQSLAERRIMPRDELPEDVRPAEPAPALPDADQPEAAPGTGSAAAGEEKPDAM